MSVLLSPIDLNGLVLKNRLVVSPMCQYSSTDGFAADWHLVHLGSRAVGGAAAVIQEATAISPEGRISPDDLGIWKDAHMEKLEQIVNFIHRQDALAGIQLAHAGRKASTATPWKGREQLTIGNGGWQTVAPSAIPFNSKDRPPVALDKQAIKEVILDFQNAARRAVTAGYDILEIHAAHGYLVHQFLSPLSNHRTDEYGGSFDNRIRFLLEIIDAVVTETNGKKNIWVRISATDWAGGGWDIEQSVRLARALKKKGVALIDVSTGGLVPVASIPVGPGYQVPFARRIREESDMPVGAIGLITTARQAEEILVGNQSDIILMAREMLRDPYFPLHAAMELDKDAAYPVQYERAKPNGK